MSNFKDGGRAFPLQYNGKAQGQTGMSLWDYYAAAALSGIRASDGRGDSWFKPGVAEAHAAESANFMLAERRRRFGGES